MTFPEPCASSQTNCYHASIWARKKPPQITPTVVPLPSAIRICFGSLSALPSCFSDTPLFAPCARRIPPRSNDKLVRFETPPFGECVLPRVAAAGEADAATRFAFLSARYAFFYQTADPNKNHRADKCNEYRPDDSSARPNPEHPEYPAADDAAKNAEDDVDQHSISAALHHLPGEPARDKPDHDPVNHGASFLPETRKDGRPVRPL